CIQKLQGEVAKKEVEIAQVIASQRTDVVNGVNGPVRFVRVMDASDSPLSSNKDSRRIEPTDAVRTNGSIRAENNRFARPAILFSECAAVQQFKALFQRLAGPPCRQFFRTKYLAARQVPTQAHSRRLSAELPNGLEHPRPTSLR